MAVVELLHGDCRTVMAGLPAASVDAVVCDPPYGLSFMGKDWDHGVPGVAFWSAALRVAKPGAHLLAFGGTRTFHRLAVAIEDAGWEIRDTVMWVYGSGFPKSHDVGKGIDKAAGAQREAVTTRKAADLFEAEREVASQSAHKSGIANGTKGHRTVGGTIAQHVDITAPAPEAARQWDGWGTALKPAWEPIIVARKPLEGTVAANVLAHGTGALNIDGCRVGTSEDFARRGERERTRGYVGIKSDQTIPALPASPLGRWPANLIHDGSDEVLAAFPDVHPAGQYKKETSPNGAPFNTGKGNGYVTREYADTGSAARFFYCAKASKADRDEGCEGMQAVRRGAMVGNVNDGDFLTGSGNPRQAVGRNHHPTVKPTELMKFLCRLITPPAGTVLDPFMGSGSTGKAAVLEGFGFIGIEQDAEYIAIARARIAHALQSHETRQHTLAL